MMKTLRIIFTILCAVCLAALYPVGVFLDMPFVFGVVAIGGTSFMLMLWCKKKQEIAESKEQGTPAKPVGDFFHPLPKTEQTDEATAQTPSTPAQTNENAQDEETATKE